MASLSGRTATRSPRWQRVRVLRHQHRRLGPPGQKYSVDVHDVCAKALNYIQDLEIIANALKEGNPLIFNLINDQIRKNKL